MGCIKKMPNGLYQIVFDLPVEGKRKQKRLSGFKTKREAELTKAKYIANYMQNPVSQEEKKSEKEEKTSGNEEKTSGNEGIETNDKTVSALYEEFIQYRCQHIKESSLTSTDSCFKLHILPYFNDFNILSLTKQEIIKWAETINAKNYSSAYKAKILYSLCSFITYCIDIKEFNIPNSINKIIKFSKSEVSREMQIYSLEDYKIFRNGALSIDDRILFDMLYFTGMRKGELLALTWQDIRPDMSVRINKTYSRKTRDGKWIITSPKSKNSTRTVYLPKFLYEVLISYKESKGAFRTDYVLGGKTPLTERTIDRARDRVFAQALKNTNGNYDLPKIRIHAFRHSHVSYLVSINTDIATIARRIGDTIEQVLKTYTHMLPGSQLQVADKLTEVTASF